LVSTNQAGTTYNPGALVNGTTYLWKIIPQNTGAFASGCSIIQFTTAAAPGCSTSPSPAASATNVNPTNTILSWSAGTGTITGYDVYFGTASTPPLVSSNQAGTTYSPAMLNGTVYFWKIVPLNNGTSASGCSTIQFTTAVGPGCTTNPSPTASATNVNPSTTL